MIIVKKELRFYEVLERNPSFNDDELNFIDRNK